MFNWPVSAWAAALFATNLIVLRSGQYPSVGNADGGARDLGGACTVALLRVAPPGALYLVPRGLRRQPVRETTRRPDDSRVRRDSRDASGLAEPVQAPGARGTRACPGVERAIGADDRAAGAREFCVRARQCDRPVRRQPASQRQPDHRDHLVDAPVHPCLDRSDGQCRGAHHPQAAPGADRPRPDHQRRWRQRPVCRGDGTRPVCLRRDSRVFPADRGPHDAGPHKDHEGDCGDGPSGDVLVAALEAYGALSVRRRRL